MLVVTSGDARSWYMIWVECEENDLFLRIEVLILYGPLRGLMIIIIGDYVMCLDGTSLKIMPPRITTRCASRETAAPRGGRTGGRTCRGGGRTGGQSVPDFSTIIAQQLQNLLPTIVAQVGDQGRGQRNGRNQNGDAVNDNIRGNVSRGCTYKEFLACNPKEYDGKGGAIVYTRWIEKMESVQDMSGCRDSQKVKYTTGSFVGSILINRGLIQAISTSLPPQPIGEATKASNLRRIPPGDDLGFTILYYPRSGSLPVSALSTQRTGSSAVSALSGMSWEDFKTLTREEFCLSNEMQKLENELWNHVMVGAGHAAYTDRFQ
ncbi:hypothetical protein Tco_1060394 [Tanacetum coccineum]